MDKFVPLGVSFFDVNFTLDPYAYIKDLYHQDDVLGFSANGMNVCFRFEDCHQLISAHGNVAREPVATEDTAKQREAFAVQFPTRAWHFRYSLTDVKSKALLNRYLLLVLDRIVLDDAVEAFKVLAQPGRHDNYLEAVRTVPMQMLLNAWGLSYTDEQLQKIHSGSVALVKSFDNFDDEVLLREGEDGISYIKDYTTEQFNNAKPGSLLHDFVLESRRDGFDDDFSIANLVTAIQSTPNTVNVSMAFILRNLVRFSNEIKPLRDNPQLINDNTVMELLRRDNHVKALARQVHTPFTLRGHDLSIGDSLYIFYPGINLDPTHWDQPLSLNLQREFTRKNQNIFGGARYACIGSRIALKYFNEVLPAVLKYLPENAQILDDEIEVDGNWVSERVITKLPILIS